MACFPRFDLSITIRVIQGVALALLITSGPAYGGPICGPGPNWVTTCPAGTISSSFSATISLDENFDNVSDLVLDLQGLAEVLLSSPVGNHIDVQLLSLTSSGLVDVPALGPIPFSLTAGQNFGLPGTGVITQRAGMPTLADASIALLFQLDFAGLPTLHNTTPLLFDGVIDRIIPIGTPFSMRGPPLQLFTAAGVPAQRVTDATLVLPEPSTALLLMSGFVGVFGVRFLRLRVKGFRGTVGR